MSSVRLDLNGVYGLSGKSCVCFSYAAGCGVAKVKVIAVTDFFYFFLLKCPLHSLKTWVDFYLFFFKVLDSLVTTSGNTFVKHYMCTGRIFHMVPHYIIGSKKGLLITFCEAHLFIHVFVVNKVYL